MNHALTATRRRIVYPCSWSAYEDGLPPKVNYTVVDELCNFWRNYDVNDSWRKVIAIINCFGEHQEYRQPGAGSEKWNVPDTVQ